MRRLEIEDHELYSEMRTCLRRDEARVVGATWHRIFGRQVPEDADVAPVLLEVKTIANEQAESRIITAQSLAGSALLCIQGDHVRCCDVVAGVVSARSTFECDVAERPDMRRSISSMGGAIRLRISSASDLARLVVTVALVLMSALECCDG
jgi:hypothetical protein